MMANFASYPDSFGQFRTVTVHRIRFYAQWLMGFLDSWTVFAPSVHICVRARVALNTCINCPTVQIKRQSIDKQKVFSVDGLFL